MNRRTVLKMTGAAVALPLMANAALAAKAEIYTGLLSNTAVGGYDPVAYFTENMPVEGNSDFQTKWKGVKWYFSSQENLDKFKANPTAYAPQYGGYCAYGVSQGAAVKGDPKLWKVVDGKLYLNINPGVQKRWEKDIPGFIKKANKKWPAVLN